MKSRNRVVADVLDARRVFGADVFALHGVAGDHRATSGRERGHEVALQIDARRKTVNIAGRELREIRCDALLPLRIRDGVSQQALGLKPTVSQPGRSDPAIDRHGRGRDEARRTDLDDLGIPVAIARRPLGADEVLGRAAARLDFQASIECRAIARRMQKARLGGGGEIGVIEIIAVQRGDRIGMEDESASAARHFMDDGFDKCARRGRVGCEAGLWIGAHDNKGAERLDRADEVRPVGRREVADIGLDLVVAQQSGSPRGRQRPDLDLVRIIGGIDRHLMAAARHRDEGDGEQHDDQCTEPPHCAVQKLGYRVTRAGPA